LSLLYYTTLGVVESISIQGGWIEKKDTQGGVSIRAGSSERVAASTTTASGWKINTELLLLYGKRNGREGKGKRGMST
jgi:hypothetical protein